MNLYAVRVGARWVEIREATKKPKAVVTQAKHLVEREQVKRTRTKEGFWAYVPQKVMVPLVIKQVVHEGGKVVKVLSYTRFATNANFLTVPVDGAALIPKRNPFHTYFRQYLGGKV